MAAAILVAGAWSATPSADPQPVRVTANNVTARPNADGSVTIQFGGDATAPNDLPIVPGWNYTVRMYRPRKAILDGTWKFPEAEAVK